MIHFRDLKLQIYLNDINIFLTTYFRSYQIKQSVNSVCLVVDFFFTAKPLPANNNPFWTMIKPTFMSACQMRIHSKSFAVDMHIYSMDICEEIFNAIF